MLILFLPEAHEFVQLGGIGEASGAKTEGVSRAGLIIRSAFFQNAQSHRLRGFEESFLVKGSQRLKGGVRARSSRAGSFARGRVENGECREGQRAFPNRVQAAAITVFSFCYWPTEPKVNRVADTGRDGGKYARAAHFRIKQTAYGEGDVLHHFTFDTESWSALEEAVVLIFGVA